MSAENVSPLPSSQVSPEPQRVPVGTSPRQIIPLDRLCAAAGGFAESNAEPLPPPLRTVGTHISHSYAHAGKIDFGSSAETYVFTHSEKVSEKRVPTVPSQPTPSPPVYTLECGDPGFRDPEDGEWIVGLYREDDGTFVPLLLWADPDVDYFWDVAQRRHALPPRFYVKLAAQPQIDPKSGHPIIDGAVCPF